MQTIIAIPGLGGRANLFNKYKALLPQFNFEFVDLLNWQETEAQLEILLDKYSSVILFCNCYGAIPALRVMKKNPGKVSSLIIVEPFFGKFMPFRKFLYFITKAVLAFMKFTDKLGLERKNFPEVDYAWVERQPLFLQPFHDLRHQSMTDYFEKCLDILEYNPAEKIETPTLLIFSPKGFVRDPAKREYLKNIFVNSKIEELGQNSHNIMTLSSKEIGKAITDWLSK